MSKKQDILNSIKYAKSEHIRWITYAEAKYDGMEVDDEMFQKDHTECECGKWILEKGQLLFHIKASQNLDEDHKQFHSLYKQLYDFMETQDQGNIFNKLLVQKKNMEVMEKYALTLRKFSNNILESFDAIYTEIEKTDEEIIENNFQKS